MIDATTIAEISGEIERRGKGDCIVLVLLCRYRNDTGSLPWKIVVNAMNIHYASGPDVDIYVPGFSFYGVSSKPGLGEIVPIENSNPLGYYYPKVLADAAAFLRGNITGMQVGATVTLIALEVRSNLPDWGNGVVMDLSSFSDVDAERQLMSVIDGCKVTPGMIEPSIQHFKANFKLNNLVSYLSSHGWSIASAFTGVGALLLSP